MLKLREETAADPATMELPAIVEKFMLSVVRFSLLELKAVIVQPDAVENTRFFTLIAFAMAVLTVRVEFMVTFPLRLRPFVIVTVGASRVMEVAAVAVIVLSDCKVSCCVASCLITAVEIVRMLF